MSHLRASTSERPHSEAIAFSPAQAAFVSSLSLRTITAAIASGELRSVTKGRRRVIFRADLESYLRSQLGHGNE